MSGGAIEAGEKPQQAGLRELGEGAGIEVPADHPLMLIDIIPVIDHRGGNWLDIIFLPSKEEVAHNSEEV